MIYNCNFNNRIYYHNAIVDKKNYKYNNFDKNNIKSKLKFFKFMNFLLLIDQNILSNL